MKLLRNIILISSLFASLNTFAQTYDSSEFKIQSTTIEEVDTPIETLFDKDLGTIISGTGQVIVVIDKLIAIGERVWKIVEAGKPVLNIDGITPSVSILPRGLADSGSLYNMFGWREPIIKTYRVAYKNYYGVNVIDFTFSVIMQYGGTDGKGGIYISGLSIVPDQVSVSWGWSFNAQTRLINISNRGTATNPIAAAMMELGYTVGSPLSSLAKKIRFFVDANGKISLLN